MGHTLGVEGTHPIRIPLGQLPQLLLCWHTHCQTVGSHPDAIHVDGLALVRGDTPVPLTRHLLRCIVLRCTSKEGFCVAEAVVSEEEVVIGVHQDVQRLDVTVSNAMLVELTHCDRQLLEESHDNHPLILIIEDLEPVRPCPMLE